MLKIKIKLSVVVIMLIAGPLFAFNLRLAYGFHDHAVLQRGKPVCIWGGADSGSRVSVAFASQEKTVTASIDGKWMVRLDPMPASSEPRELVVRSGGSTLRRA